MKTYLQKCLGFLCIILLFPQNSTGQSVITLNDSQSLFDIAIQTSYLEDASLQRTIQEITSDSLQTKFTPNTQENINFSSTASAYWLKFTVNKTIAEDFYVKVGSAYIDIVSLFEFDENGQLLSERHTGDDLPFNTREIEVGSYLFKLDLQENTTRTYYMRVKSDQPLFFTLRAGTLPNFVKYIHDLDFIQGIYFGFMLLIFLYNLFLFFSTKEKIYLYYIAYVVSITWFMASVFGYFFEYFWPNVPAINQLVVISAGLTMITATLFTQRFLNTKEADPKMHKGSMLFLLIGIVVCVLVPLGFKIEGLKLSQGGLLIMAIYFITLGIRFRMKGYRPANYYLLAWGALVIGIIFAIMESLNVVGLMKYLNAMQIGSALEVMLLSFALGDRINMYKKQKEIAQEKALQAAKENERLIREQNIILENKVEERTKRLIDLNKEKDLLLSMVAHDLRTPLHQVKSLIYLLDIPSTDLTEEQKAFVMQIENSTDRMSEMIGSMLNTHALDNKQLDLNPKIIDVEKLILYVSNSFDFTAQEKNITIRTEVQPGTHFIKADKNYIIQVLENLISNAIKFSFHGNDIIVKVETIQKRTYISVIDKGPGISEEDQQKLYGKFQRLSAKPTAGESSIGLGLSIVKKFVEAMNGEINCTSTLGEGTTFTVIFATQEAKIKVPVNAE
ncbi:MAG: sensor histidine kinase [Bacteroidota bacterium]